MISYSVGRRTNEMGLRLAVGASPGGLRWLVVRDSLVLVGAGLAVGVALWFPVLGLTRSLLYGVSPPDTQLLAISVAVLLLVGAVADGAGRSRVAHRSNRCDSRRVTLRPTPYALRPAPYALRPTRSMPGCTH